jgi:hypothetical protein
MLGVIADRFGCFDEIEVGTGVELFEAALIVPPRSKFEE